MDIDRDEHGEPAPGRQGTAPPGQQPGGGLIPGAPPQYPQPAYGTYRPAPYGQPPYGPPTYGQPPYGSPTYGSPTYGQPSYGTPGYGQLPYGQPGYHGVGRAGPGQPARPGAVITAAVLGLVHGALGVLVAVGFLAGGALVDDLVDVVAAGDPSVDPGEVSAQIDGVRAVLVGIAVLALAWTVVMVWGSVLALRGRSRVLLLVGASIAVAATGLAVLVGAIGLVATPDASGQAGGVLLLLAFFLAALAMLVLLCLRSAGQFFAVHRQRRALPAS